VRAGGHALGLLRPGRSAAEALSPLLLLGFLLYLACSKGLPDADKLQRKSPVPPAFQLSDFRWIVVLIQP
jgi:hypothetical protein